ncbi:MAG: hypothetical protein WB797_10605 [Nocardioides sp.]
MNRTTGLVILALLSLVDIVDLAVTDGEHPPYSIAVAGAALGLASLVLVAYCWGGRRWAVAPLVALRSLSALSAVPAFVVGGVPAAAVVLAAAIVVLTILGIVLVARPMSSVRVAG